MEDMRDVLVQRLITALATLKEKPFKNIEINVREVLYLTYETGIVNINFKPDERQLIGSLIKDVIKPIDGCIFNIGYSFERNNVASNLVLRSGLQFMLDNFKNFPVSQNETLEETFKYFKDTESIETIDDALRCWKNSNIPLTEEDATINENEITKPKDVPNSHTWWY